MKKQPVFPEGDGEGYGPDKIGGHFPVTKEYQEAEDRIQAAAMTDAEVEELRQEMKRFDDVEPV